MIILVKRTQIERASITYAALFLPVATVFVSAVDTVEIAQDSAVETSAIDPENAKVTAQAKIINR